MIAATTGLGIWATASNALDSAAARTAISWYVVVGELGDVGARREHLLPAVHDHRPDLRVVGRGLRRRPQLLLDLGVQRRSSGAGRAGSCRCRRSSPAVTNSPTRVPPCVVQVRRVSATTGTGKYVGGGRRDDHLLPGPGRAGHVDRRPDGRARRTGWASSSRSGTGRGRRSWGAVAGPWRPRRRHAHADRGRRRSASWSRWSSHASAATTIALVGGGILIGLAAAPLADVLLELVDRSYDRGSRDLEIWAGSAAPTCCCCAPTTRSASARSTGPCSAPSKATPSPADPIPGDRASTRRPAKSWPRWPALLATSGVLHFASPRSRSTRSCRARCPARRAPGPT